MRRIALVLLVFVGIVGVVIATGRDPARSTAGSAAAGPATVAPVRPRPAAPAPRVVAAEATLSVWRVGHLTAAQTRRIARLPAVESVSVTSGGLVLLSSSRDARGRVVDRPPGGHAIPLDALGIEPATYARGLDGRSARALARLGRGEALLSATSARVRGLRAGGRLELDGGEALRIAAVVPDDAVRAAEVVVERVTARRLGLRPRAALVTVAEAAAEDPAAAARAVRRAAGRGVRVRASRSRAARRPSGLLRQSVIKARFGEFAVRLPLGADWVELDPRWRARTIATRPVPLLGPVTCHRAMLGPLRRALGELERRGLGRLVDPGDYAGCHAPRRIPSSGAMSRHAWGLAVDLNAAANPYGARSRQDPRLVATLRRHGFAWGGNWPTPDAMHFEYVGDRG